MHVATGLAFVTWVTPGHAWSWLLTAGPRGTLWLGASGDPVIRSFLWPGNRSDRELGKLVLEMATRSAFWRLHTARCSIFLVAR